jgi:hypothetical protein
VYNTTTNKDKEEEMEEEYHINDLEYDKEEEDENGIYEIINVSNVNEKENLIQDDKDDESNNTD